MRLRVIGPNGDGPVLHQVAFLHQSSLRSRVRLASYFVLSLVFFGRRGCCTVN